MNIKAILIVSLLSNALLAGYGLSRRPSPPSPADVSTPLSTGTTPAALTKLDRQTVTNTITKRITWEMVESGDYKQYIANLRSIGCPEETIRDIIIADVNKLYEQKKKALKGGGKRFEYWKTGNPMIGGMDTGLLQKIRALDEEKNAVLRDLGITLDTKTEMAQALNPFDAMMDFLPEAKKAGVMKIMTDMQSKMVEASKDGTDLEAMSKAMKDMETGLKGIMTPEEFLDYQLRFSMTANIMRNQIAGFDPNEGEFMTVFKLREAFDSEFSPMTRNNENEEQRKIREEAEGKLNENLKNALGTDRYAQYERAQDWNFQQIYQATKKADLDTTEAVKVYDIKKIAEKEVFSVLNNKDITQADRISMLQQMKQQTEASVKSILGEKGWDQYNRGINTHWIKNLNPIPPQ